MADPVIRSIGLCAGVGMLDMSRASSAAYRANNLEKVRERDRARGKLRWLKAPEKMNATRRNSNRKLREQVINEYGGKCQCCGEARFEFLAIDHIFEDGAKERLETGKRSAEFHRWLRDQGFPKGRHQVLCHNCNQAKSWYGECPHEREKLCG